MRQASGRGLGLARRVSRRRIFWTGGVLLVALAATGAYLRAKYDVIGTVRSTVLQWESMHTGWLVASSEEIDRQIEEARKAWPFPATPPGPAVGPLHVLASNPRYFTDGSGRAVYLAGLHTWSDFQDNGGSDPPPVFDYGRFLDFLQAHHLNFMRLWVWESPRWTLETPDDNYWFYPEGPWARTGPGIALDGKPKWDLTRFNQSYFDRLRRRVMEAGERGIYVSVMLFNGWSVATRKGSSAKGDPWEGHPFNKANNVNGINGDRNGDGSGIETQELGDERILAIQEAYVRKVIATVGDLDNVLYEVCNEGDTTSTLWQYHMIDFIKDYEADRPKQHPVGMTAEYPGGRDSVLFASNADWVSPEADAALPPSGAMKVVISDTDHIFGIGGSRRWVWESFTRGLNVAFMDGYDGAGYGVGGLDFHLADPRWVSLRRNLGYVREYAERMNLAEMQPRPDLCSTKYCLVSTSARSAEYLVYAPEGGEIKVDLSALGADMRLTAEWFDPDRTRIIRGRTTEGGGVRSFRPPFDGDAVLYVRAVS